MALRVGDQHPPSCCPSPLPGAPRPRGGLWAGGASLGDRRLLIEFFLLTLHWNKK